MTRMSPTSYRVVRDELDAYGAGLADKPVVVALNKIDTLDDELIAALSAELAEASGQPVFPLSAAGEIGIEAGARRAARAARRAERGRGRRARRSRSNWSPL